MSTAFEGLNESGRDGRPIYDEVGDIWMFRLF